MTAIVASDVVYYLSAPSASTGYATTGVAGSSWGGWFSTTALSGTPLDNLFSDITGAENAASQVDYACVFVLNNTASGNSMLNAVAWLPTASYVAGGANVTVANVRLPHHSSGRSHAGRWTRLCAAEHCGLWHEWRGAVFWGRAEPY